MSDFSLTKLIDTWIAENREPKKYDSWRASLIGSCPRKHFFKRLGVEDTTPGDERQQRVFEAGHIFHKFVQDIASNVGDPEIEGEIYDKELDLGGRYDILLGDEDGKTILYDIKTQHSRSFWWMLRKSKGYTDKDGNAFPPVNIADQQPHHKMQLAAYMVMLKRAGTAVDEGRILYLSKDDLATEEVIHHLTPELEKKVLDEVAMLNKHWKAKTLPPCTCEGWQCRYCPYSDPKVPQKDRTECCFESLYEKN